MLIKQNKTKKINMTALLNCNRLKLQNFEWITDCQFFQNKENFEWNKEQKKRSNFGNKK